MLKVLSFYLLLINNEIVNAKNGNEAWIKIKINNITSYSLIRSLYNASRAGVKIQMIVRGICCLIPGHKSMSENIKVISIVDRFLEHTRFMIFNNNNDNKVFISSADWMTRNLDNRVEVTCPIYDEDIKLAIKNYKPSKKESFLLPKAINYKSIFFLEFFCNLRAKKIILT